MYDSLAYQNEQNNMVEVTAYVGNVIRLVTVVELDEIDAIHRMASTAEMEAMLLDPTAAPRTPSDAAQNCMLLTALRAFRAEIDRITSLSQPLHDDASAPQTKRCEAIG